MTMLDQNSIIPLYYQLKEILKEKIKGGSWREGKVPSERQLMEIYQVSRATARSALSVLMVEGLIYKKQGVGTFVSKSKVTQKLIGELNFNQLAKRKGFTPGAKVIYAALDNVVPNRISEILRLNELQSMFKIVRVRLVNEQPLIIESLYIPQHYCPNLLVQDVEKVGAVLHYLQNDCSVSLTHSTLDIESVLTNEFQAQYLGSKAGMPALSLERVIYSEDNAVMFQKRIMRGDSGKFSFTLGENLVNEDEFILGLEFKNSPHSDNEMDHIEE